MNCDLCLLLSEVDALFVHKKLDKTIPHPYDYSLNKHPQGWIFTVVNDWHKWLNVGYESDFGAYRKPEHAVDAFLDYVKKNKINVHKLMDW